MLIFRRLRQELLLLVLLMLPLFPGTGEAAVPLMPLEEVRVGAQGVARTVIAGTLIEEFGVEVLGIMKNKGAVGDLILVRTYGDVIDRAGGVAQGMSGSPVFIDGRLIGAIGYGWKLTDQRTAMVTPIQDMLKLLELPAETAPEPEPVKPAEPAKPAEPVKPAEPDKAADKKTDQAPAKKSDKPANRDAGKTLSTPLMAAGFGPAALAYLQAKLKPLNLNPVAAGDAPEGISYGQLEPGSAVGVQLVRGDVSLGALGTVTYVDGDRVLAFGHPFLKRGPTGFLMTNAYIFTTIHGLESSFKLGSTGEAIGTINQDRGAGVAGEMNRFPGVVPLRMKIQAEAAGQPREMAVQMVQDEEIVPILATASLLGGIEKGVDRSGPGTARITFEVSADGMPGEIFRRENMFYSPENVAEAALSEFYEFLAFLASNPHNRVKIMDIQADVQIGRERKTARILSAKPLKTTAAPGDVVDIEVKLKPYRAEPITRSVSFTVPKEQKEGLMNLSVRGGGFFSIAALLKKLTAEGAEAAKPTRKPPKSFEEQMKEFTDRDRNNDIVAEISGAAEAADETALGEKKPKLTLSDSEKSVRTTPEEPAKQEKPARAKPADSLLSSKKPEKKVKGVLTTDFIVEGDAEVSITIAKPAAK